MIRRFNIFFALFVAGFVLVANAAESDVAPGAAPAASAEVAAPPAADAAVPVVDSVARAAPVAATTTTGTGTVIFFRPSRFVGAAIGFKVRENDKELGKLRSGKYFVLNVAPGTHEYVVHSETKDTLVLEVEAGQTYYVQGALGVGIVAGRPNLSPSDQAAFDAAKPKMKEVPPLTDDAE
jgi:hypothetical protein